MRKMMLVGRSESGKTTLTQALRGENLHYHKTQYINYHDVIIDTPGEYAQTKGLGRALALYSYEADVIGLLMSATEAYSLYPPCVTAAANREVIGIITKCDHENANIAQAENWLRLAGCDKIFPISSYTGEGIDALMEYLAQDTKKIPERI
ncbi:MAG: EutP/PduV family microcompartment system protein [Clostridia bacterium]|nr:EutP/PduV family microcompartment system protein [Clostridia bacterium]